MLFDLWTFSTGSFARGYATGLIVGEGSFAGDPRPGASSPRLHERDPLPFQLLCRVFGGRVYGPCVHDERRHFPYHLRGREPQPALPPFDRYLPSSHRREQYEAWRAKYFSHIPVPDTGHVTFPGLDE